MTADAHQRILAIDLTSDPVCGYSYIAYRRIQQAIDNLVQTDGPTKAVIRHHPYILFPTLPEHDKSVTRMSWFKHDLGDGAEAYWGTATVEALSSGIHFASDLLIGQTIDIQRILLHALKTLGAAYQFRLLGIIFHAEFETGQDVFKPPFIAAAASRPLVGADGAARSLFAHEQEALEWIQGGDLRAEVIESGRKARHSGIQTIPLMVLNGRYAICGAREVSEYYESFRKAALESEEARGP